MDLADDGSILAIIWYLYSQRDAKPVYRIIRAPAVRFSQLSAAMFAVWRGDAAGGGWRPGDFHDQSTITTLSEEVGVVLVAGATLKAGGGDGCWVASAPNWQLKLPWAQIEIASWRTAWIQRCNWDS